MISMTGFSSLTTILEDAKGKKISISVSIKSVNSRFFEVTCRLPSAFHSLEVESMNLLRSLLLRGKCFLSINYGDPHLSKEDIQPSLASVGNYLKAITLIQETYPIPGTLSITDILTLPGLFLSTEVQSDEAMQAATLNAIKQAAQLLMETRKTEGEVLLLDINERLTLIQETFKLIEQNVKNNFNQRTIKIKAELKVLEEIKDSEMLRHQITNELNRSDITEELVRFNTHLSSFYAVAEDSKIEKGRQLDFILQELGREINTIAAKSSDAVISHGVITIKVELEKIKEQIQNII